MADQEEQQLSLETKDLPMPNIDGKTEGKNSAPAAPIYIDPTEDPYNKAISYLERHNILQLFQHLTSDVIYHRPNDPLEYLIQEVQQMKQQREAQQSAK